MNRRDIIGLRETLQCAVETDYAHRAARRGQLAFARVEMRFEPAPWQTGVRSESEVPLTSATGALLAGVAHGIEAVAQLGLFAGRPVIGVRATLLRALPGDLEHPFIPFAIAAAIAFRRAAVGGRAAVVEPIMRVEVVTPTEAARNVAHALKTRRGLDIRLEEAANPEITFVTALAPHAEIFDVFSILRAVTQDRCEARMALHSYAPAPDQPQPGPWEPTDNGPDLFPPAVGMRA